jgi:multidrug efflux pump subunit AcrB
MSRRSWILTGALLAGALLSLWYFNQTVDIFSQIGMIMLMGS